MVEERALPEQENLLGDKVIIINLGLAIFEESLRRQGVEVVSVNWRPPSVLSKDVEDLLDDLL